VCFHRHGDRGNDDAFLGGSEDRDPAIQIDLSPEALGRNYPLKASVLGDIKVTLARMLENADGSTAAKRKPCSRSRARSAPSGIRSTARSLPRTPFRSGRSACAAS